MIFISYKKTRRKWRKVSLISNVELTLLILLALEFLHVFPKVLVHLIPCSCSYYFLQSFYLFLQQFQLITLFLVLAHITCSRVSTNFSNSFSSPYSFFLLILLALEFLTISPIVLVHLIPCSSLLKNQLAQLNIEVIIAC